MADNTNKVTIDADYFAELWNNANKKIANEGEYFKVCKERDELKAKLDAAEVDRETYKDRAEAAERELPDCAAVIMREWERISQ